METTVVELTLRVRVSGNYRSALDPLALAGEARAVACPGYPAHIDDLVVELGDHDITSFLTGHNMQVAEDALLDHVEYGG